MAKTYKNALVDFTTTDNTTVYTVPDETTSIINGFLLQNETASSTTVDVTLLDSSSNVFYLFKGGTVAAYTEYHLLSQPLVLAQKEIIKIQVTNADRATAILSILEISGGLTANIYLGPKKSLTTTGQTTLYTVPDARTAVVNSIILCEMAGNTPTVTTVINDGTSDFHFNIGAMSANETADLLTRGLVLEQDHSIRITSTVSNSVDTVISLLEIDPSGG